MVKHYVTEGGISTRAYKAPNASTKYKSFLAGLSAAALAFLTPMETSAQCPSTPDPALVEIAQYLVRNGKHTRAPNVTLRINDNTLKGKPGYSDQFFKGIAGVVFEGKPADVAARYTDSGKANDGQNIADRVVGPEDFMEFLLYPGPPFKDWVLIMDAGMNGCLKDQGDSMIKLSPNGNRLQERPYNGIFGTQEVDFARGPAYREFITAVSKAVKGNLPKTTHK